jgi:hypothetical protein
MSQWNRLAWGLGLLSLGWGSGAIALDASSSLLLTQPLTAAEIDLLEAGTPPADPDWVTANTVSQTTLTTPSLWWVRQQFGGKLLNNWLAKPATVEMPNRVDLLVNQQVWNRYNYIDRYAFLNQVGTSAQDFGYSTRVFNAQGELLGAYICEFESERAGSVDVPAAADCTIFLDPSGTGAVRGRSTTGAFQPIGGSISR